jgi:ribosomal protein S17E
MRLSERSSKMLRETVEDKKLLVVELAKVCSTKQEFLETVMHEFGQDKDFNEIYDTIKKTATNLYDKYAPKEIKDQRS